MNRRTPVVARPTTATTSGGIPPQSEPPATPLQPLKDPGGRSSKNYDGGDQDGRCCARPRLHSRIVSLKVSLRAVDGREPPAAEVYVLGAFSADREGDAQAHRVTWLYRLRSARGDPLDECESAHHEAEDTVERDHPSVELFGVESRPNDRDTTDPRMAMGGFHGVSKDTVAAGKADCPSGRVHHRK